MSSDQSIPVSTTTTARLAARAGEQVRAIPLTVRVRKMSGSVVVYAFLIVMTIFALFPIYYVVQASFNSTQALYSVDLSLIPHPFTLDNYRRIITQYPFLNWMKSSIIACGLATIIALMCATTGAYALSRFKFRGRAASIFGLVALQTFPGLLAIYAYLDILQSLRLDGTLIGLAIVYAAGNVVFGALNIKGYFDTIPPELEEAARVDGASNFRTFVQVILPLAAPAIAASALFMFIGGWNEFALASIILPAGNDVTVPVGLNLLQQDQYTPWGIFAAASVLVSVPLAAIFLYLQRFFKSGLTIGSVKG